MTKTNLDLAVSLDRECFPDRPLSRDQWRKVLKGVGGLDCWLYPDRGCYAVVQWAEEGGYPVCRLLRLGVTSRQRGKGHAKELLGRLTQANCEATVSERNLPALKLLCGAGFEVLGLVGSDRDRVVLYRCGEEG